MAKRSVDILIQGRDRASRKFRNVSKATDVLAGRLRSLALRASGVAVAFLGFRKVYRVLDSAMTDKHTITIIKIDGKDSFHLLANLDLHRT